MELQLTFTEEIKISSVLDYFLSLHESDEVFNMIFNPAISPEEIEDKLNFFLKRGKYNEA